MSQQAYLLTWRLTWPEDMPLNPDDGICSDCLACIGRVIWTECRPRDGAWFWTAHGSPGANSGRVDTKDDARALVEATYLAFAADPRARRELQVHLAGVTWHSEMFLARGDRRHVPTLAEMQRTFLAAAGIPDEASPSGPG